MAANGDSVKGKGYSLDDAVRKIPDFPKPGILFYDITSILANPEAFRYCIEGMKGLYASERIDAIAGIESRGFVFASPFALDRGIPLILIRKKGKLPGATISEKYALEYGEAEIEAHVADIKPGMRVLLVDDLIATGGTLKAAIALIERAGASVAGIFGVIGLPFLDYASKLSGYEVRTLLEYFGE
jgi:adenine phosphoribosyltransferase